MERDQDAVCDVSAMAGIGAYEPSEYTMTVAAGTPLKDVQTALDEHGQYLPFDPWLVESGATVGGTVAANAAGPGRLRHGGVRDFILGVQLVDGLGQLSRQGARVVKNAAGLDIPKLMVGSLGALGCLTEVTFKVFPAPALRRTVLAHQLSLQAAESLTHSLLKTGNELLALDLISVEVGSAGRQWSLALRMGGRNARVERRASSLEAWARARSASEHDVELLQDEADSAFWRRITELKWVGERHAAVKIPITVPRFVDAEQRGVFSQFDRVLSGTQQLLLSVPGGDLERVDQALRQLGLSGQILCPSKSKLSCPTLIGALPGRVLLEQVKQALDPNDRFSRAVWGPHLLVD